MGNVLVNEQHLTDIADAIREKNGTEETYKPSEMATAITSIVSSEGISNNFALKYMTQTLTEDDVNYLLSLVGQSWQQNQYYTYEVTEVPPYAFAQKYGRTYWDEITVPEGYETIGEYAFYGCRISNSLSLPEGLKVIKDHAFANMSNKTNFEFIIPSTVEKIEDYAFAYSTYGSIKFEGNSLVPWNQGPIGENAFTTTNAVDIYVPWLETDDVNLYAPWGAENATIHYGYTG